MNSKKLIWNFFTYCAFCCVFCQIHSSCAHIQRNCMFGWALEWQAFGDGVLWHHNLSTKHLQVKRKMRNIKKNIEILNLKVWNKLKLTWHFGRPILNSHGKTKCATSHPIDLHFFRNIFTFLLRWHHPLNTSEESIHHLGIKSETTGIRKCRVEIDTYSMNGAMEGIVPSLINHSLYDLLFL